MSQVHDPAADRDDPQPASGEPALTLANVGVSYRRGLLRREEFWALRGLDLEVNRGENLGVIGRNGAGKSTLLRLLSGIYAPDEGSIDHHGNSASLLSLQVGFIAHLSGRDNAILSGMMLGKRKQEMQVLLAQIIEYSGLHQAIDKPLRTYSTGMRARLGFAVSYYADADILLIDEVLGVGDTQFRQKSATTMRERIQSNKTVVLVSHNPRMIRALCTRVLWIEAGAVRDCGDLGVLDDYERASKKEKLVL